MNEALRLLRDARKWVLIGDSMPPAWREPILKWREDVDSFLASVPETAAREAVLAEALRRIEWGTREELQCAGSKLVLLSRRDMIDIAIIALADLSPAAAALLAQGEPCGKCRVHTLVIAEAKRHLKSVLGWVPDNDARREAARFLRMSERQVRAALGEPE